MIKRIKKMKNSCSTISTMLFGTFIHFITLAKTKCKGAYIHVADVAETIE
jgi:hypothetical protein